MTISKICVLERSLVRSAWHKLWRWWRQRRKER